MLSGSKLVVNLTLDTLYEAFRWLPAKARPADEPKDDWTWTLRLSAESAFAATAAGWSAGGGDERGRIGAGTEGSGDGAWRGERLAEMAVCTTILRWSGLPTTDGR